MRSIGIAALILLAPPSLWAALLWSGPAASGLPKPWLAYGLAAMVMAPGAIGLWMFDLRTRTRWLILPPYLMAMSIGLLATMVLLGRLTE